MLNELNSITRDLLGLHGYPLASAAASAPSQATQCEDRPDDVVSACTQRARKAFVVAKRAFGPSAMGHVFW